MHDDIERILYTAQDLKEIIATLAEQIEYDYAGTSPVFVGILRGSVIFCADLIRALNLPLEIDFMAVSSYGAGTTSSGHVEIIKDLSTDIKGRDVLIVEDIFDTGLTLKELMALLSSRGAASLKVVTLLQKEGTQRCDLRPDYVGMVCPNEFVVGYGLDYAERYRNLEYIGVLKPQVYTHNSKN